MDKSVPEDKRASEEEVNDLLGPEPVRVDTQPEQRHPFKEYTYAELTSAPRKTYLCGDDDHPVLLSNALWQTIGLLKSGKTYFCLELGFCIAFGFDFHGLRTEEGNVAYILAEGGIGRNFERVLALCAKYEQQLRAKFHLSGTDDHVAAAMDSGKFNLIDSPVDLAAVDPTKGLGVDVLLDQLEHRPYAAVFLDTWARMLWASGGHDSDQNTVGPAVQGCDRLQRALGCTVVMVAHVGVARDAQGRAKGLSDPAGAVDGATLCKKIGDGALAQYSFTATYQRHAIDGYQIVAQLRPSGKNVALMSDNIQSAIKLNARERQILDALRKIGDAAPLSEWQRAVEALQIVDRKGNQLKPDAIRKAFGRAKKQLVAANAVVIHGDIASLPSSANPVFGSADEEFSDEGQAEV